jgi:hypothetical protein
MVLAGCLEEEMDKVTYPRITKTMSDVTELNESRRQSRSATKPDIARYFARPLVPLPSYLHELIVKYAHFFAIPLKDILVGAQERRR